jgi:hypothetical protein
MVALDLCLTGGRAVRVENRLRASAYAGVCRSIPEYSIGMLRRDGCLHVRHRDLVWNIIRCACESGAAAAARCLTNRVVHLDLTLLVSSWKKFSTTTSSLGRIADAPTGRSIRNRPSGATSKSPFAR